MSKYIFETLLDFYFIREKEDYIRDTSKDRDYFSCTVCGDNYFSLDEALNCCWEDCQEQTDEFYRDREFYFRGDE